MTAAGSPAGRGLTLRTLQMGRGIAALMVVLHHAGGSIFGLDKYWGRDPTGHLFDFGAAGVEFFFVLSGFIILHVHWQDLGRPQRFGHYLRKRLVRIYPIYWVVLLPVALLYYRGGHRFDPLQLASSVVLLNFHDEYTRSVLTVAWTLYHEMLFYLVFSLLMLQRRLGGLVLCLWLAGSSATLILALCSVYPAFLGHAGYFYFSPMHSLFALGMAVCWTVRRGRVPLPGFTALAGIVLFLAAALEEDYLQLLDSNLRVFLYGLGSAMAVCGGVELERSGRLAPPRFTQLLGDASYSLYLVHFPMLSLLARLLCLPALKPHLPLALAYVLVVGLAVTAGVLLHLWVERPLLQRLGGGTPREQGRRP